jgi:hypothetical protein
LKSYHHTVEIPSPYLPCHLNAHLLVMYYPHPTSAGLASGSVFNPSAAAAAAYLSGMADPSSTCLSRHHPSSSSVDVASRPAAVVSPPSTGSPAPLRPPKSPMSSIGDADHPVSASAAGTCQPFYGTTACGIGTQRNPPTAAATCLVRRNTYADVVADVAARNDCRFRSRCRPLQLTAM